MMDSTPELLSAFLKEFTFYSSVAMTAMARWLGFFFIFPFFRWIQIPMPIRNATCLALSLPVWPTITRDVAASKLPIYPAVSDSVMGQIGFNHFAGLMGVVGKEFVLGVLLGIMPAIFFYSLIFVGELLDQARQDSNQSAAAGDSLQMTTTGFVLFLGAGMSLFYSDGLFRILLVFYDTFVSMPISNTEGFFELKKMHVVSNTAMNLLTDGIKTAWPLLVLIWSFQIITFFQTKIDKKFHGTEALQPMINLIFIIVLMFFLRHMASADGYNQMLLQAMKQVH